VSPPLIALDELGFRHGSHPVLQGLSLRIATSERVGILGASGVGKSTLLQLMAGLVAPAAGSVQVAGIPVTGPVPGATVMFQRPALLPWASVLDNVLLPARLSGRLRRDRAAIRTEALQILGEVGLAERIDAKPHQLSGGQQQRVALARALASAPRILLLDEPFSALDPEMRDALRRDVRRLARERGLTLVIVTHDLADVAALADRAVLLGGRPARVVQDFALGPGAEAELRARFGTPDRRAA
jgi:NitT/TauT family transport system ATP-binding protein